MFTILALSLLCVILAGHCACPVRAPRRLLLLPHSTYTPYKVTFNSTTAHGVQSPPPTPESTSSKPSNHPSLKLPAVPTNKPFPGAPGHSDGSKGSPCVCVCYDAARKPMRRPGSFPPLAPSAPHPPAPPTAYPCGATQVQPTPTAPSNPPFGPSSGARLEWSHGPIKRGAAGPGRARKPPVGAPLAEQAEGHRAVSPGPVDVTAGRTARGAQGVRANRGGSWLKRRVRFQRSHPRRRGATTARAVWGRWGKRKR